MSDAKPQRQPILNVPAVLVAVLAVLAAVQAVRGVLPPEADDSLFSALAFVPARLTALLDPSLVTRSLQDLGAGGADAQFRLAAARFFLAGGSSPWSVVTYALLHANWTHFGLNAVWLLAFGTPVARRIRAIRFLALLVVGAAAGALTHLLLYPADVEPLVGASAAVSAAMGAALRFVFRPARRSPSEADEPSDERLDWQPAIAIPQLMRDRRAAAFLVVWLVTNVVTGLGPVAQALAGGPIAWEAHIGGFLVGFLGFAWFDPKPPDLPVPPLFAEPDHSSFPP